MPPACPIIRDHAATAVPNSLSAAPLLVLTALAGCKVYDPLYCDENTECNNSERPFCDLEGDYPASDGVPRTCIPDPNSGSDADGGGNQGEPDAGQEPVACSNPGDALACEDDILVSCSVDSVEERSECALGCSTDELRCFDLDPSNDLATYLDQAATADPLLLTGVASFDTDTGNLINGDKTDVFVQTTLIEASEDGVPVRIVVASRVDFIRVNTRHGTFVPGTTALISPSASAGTTATR